MAWDRRQTPVSCVLVGGGWFLCCFVRARVPPPLAAWQADFSFSRAQLAEATWHLDTPARLPVFLRSCLYPPPPPPFFFLTYACPPMHFLPFCSAGTGGQGQVWTREGDRTGLVGRQAGTASDRGPVSLFPCTHFTQVCGFGVCFYLLLSLSLSLSLLGAPPPFSPAVSLILLFSLYSTCTYLT